MTVTGIILAIIAALLLGLGLMARQAPDLGRVEGKLRPCPDKPNCVCSDIPPENQLRHAIAPIVIRGHEGRKAWALFHSSILASGGVMMHATDTYLHAEFTSMIFRFVDDVEARLDEASGQIHLRSASRIGHSDFGANRRRMENIVRVFEEMR